jgi:hypothetical protein
MAIMILVIIMAQAGYIIVTGNNVFTCDLFCFIFKGKGITKGISL